MNYLYNLVNSSAEYPKNQAHLGSSQFVLDAYFQELNANARSIFQDHARASTWVKESSDNTGCGFSALYSYYIPG